ncbi:c-type heme family protein [Lujinxingia vulgaris]|uniref:c-type heme family protein n=1 Tax=Lujinxingia vulgaris TaxID=2600176 RepID=UPI001E3D621D|nr:DUF3365 domain-containing protein [Lujinxingia vulgaris]
MKRAGGSSGNAWKRSSLLSVAMLAGALLLGACERSPASTQEGEEAPGTEIAEGEAQQQGASAPATTQEAGDEGGETLPAGWSQLEAERLSPDQQSQLERARQARQALASTLMGRVMGVVQEKGAPAAVEVCHREAGVLTAEVGREHGVRIGRFSEKLRNADNQPPQWAAAMANEAGEERVGVGPQQELAVLSPIRIAAPCLTCHGERESLAPQVARAIETYYPEDRATGYAEGDLRGWFWVEVPGS